MSDTLTWVRGASQELTVALVNEYGDPYLPAAGETLVFGVKAAASDEKLLLRLTETEHIGGVYTLRIAPEDTAALVSDSYRYGVGILSGKDYYAAIGSGELKLLDNVLPGGGETC